MNDQTKTKPNPANEVSVSEIPKGFIPMSSGSQRLKVPERDGFHRHWFRGDAKRLGQAQRAGYTFIEHSDVDIENFDLGGDAKTSGNSDMGSRVSIISGAGEDGKAERLYLMECPQHLYELSLKQHQDINDSVADAISGGTDGAGAKGETQADVQKRYMTTPRNPLFTRKS